MRIIYSGAESSSNLRVLQRAGVREVGLNYRHLRSRSARSGAVDLSPYAGMAIHVYPGNLHEDPSADVLDLPRAYLEFVEDNHASLASWMTYSGPEDSPEQALLQALRDDLPPNMRIGLRPEDPAREMPVGSTLVATDWRSMESEPGFQGLVADLCLGRACELYRFGGRPGSGYDWVDGIYTVEWSDPAKYGSLLVWSGGKLSKYQARDREGALARHSGTLSELGLDPESWEDMCYLATWSLQRACEQVSDNKGESGSKPEPGSNLPASISSAIDMRYVGPPQPRPQSERMVLPVVDISSRQVVSEKDGHTVIQDVPVVESRASSLRRCDGCFVARTCPEFQPGSGCAFDLPLEVKTREQVVSMLNWVIEMQGARVAFARYAEEMNGGYPDESLSKEIDRLLKLVKQSKDIQDDRASFKMTVQSRGSGGVLSAIFGDKAVQPPAS